MDNKNILSYCVFFILFSKVKVFYIILFYFLQNDEIMLEYFQKLETKNE